MSVLGGYLKEEGFGVVDPLSLHLTHVHGLFGSVPLLSVTQNNIRRQWWLLCYLIVIFLYITLLLNQGVAEMKRIPCEKDRERSKLFFLHYYGPHYHFSLLFIAIRCTLLIPASSIPPFSTLVLVLPIISHLQIESMWIQMKT